jgi:circadian clock protein KaiB
MMSKAKAKGIDKTEKPVEEKKVKHVLRLYVAGTSRRSFRAIKNLQKLLKDGLEDEYELEIIDIYQQPIFAKSGHIVAAPTLIKELPPPLRRFVGDLSDTEKILAGLDFSPRK